MRKISKLLKENWSILAQFGVWIVAILSCFVISPQFRDYDTSWTYRFAQFLAASILGLMIIPIQKWNTKGHTWKWWLISFLILLSSVIVLYEYYQELDQFTVKYGRTNIVVGDDENLLHEAQTNKLAIEEKKGIKLNNEDLVKWAAGKTETVWKAEILRSRKFMLIKLYILTMSLFALFIISILQAINCQFKRK